MKERRFLRLEYPNSSRNHLKLPVDNLAFELLFPDRDAWALVDSAHLPPSLVAWLHLTSVPSPFRLYVAPVLGGEMIMVGAFMG